MAKEFQFKDLLGRDIKAGDYIAYPTTSGRSAMMNLYRVLQAEVTEAWDRWAEKTVQKPAFKVQKLVTTHYQNTAKASYLAFPEKALLLNAADVEKILNG